MHQACSSSCYCSQQFFRTAIGVALVPNYASEIWHNKTAIKICLIIMGSWSSTAGPLRQCEVQYCKWSEQIQFVTVTSSSKVIWEEGRVAALSHTYAVKTPLVTMARPKFAPKSTPSRGPIPKSHYPSNLWCQTAFGSDPPFFHNALDKPTHRATYGQTHRPTDCPRESLITRGRRATTATRPNNRLLIAASSGNSILSDLCKTLYKPLFMAFCDPI